MELILVRHGQPAWSTPDGRGVNDPGLTPLGHAQAAAVAARLGDHGDAPAAGPVDRLFISPAVRAQETAAPIGPALGVAGETRGWLTELRSAPEWDGQPIEEVEARFIEIRGRSRAAMWDGIEGAEPFRDFHERVIGGVRSLLVELGITPAAEDGLWDVGPAAPQRVVLVAHAGTNSTIIAHLLGIEPQPWELDRFAMGHASVAVLTTTDCAGAHLWSLRALGDANHLPLLDRTQ